MPFEANTFRTAESQKQTRVLGSAQAKVAHVQCLNTLAAAVKDIGQPLPG
jgi:hypothetical protein